MRSRAAECPVPLGGKRWIKEGSKMMTRKNLESESQHNGEVELGVICIRVKMKLYVVL